jgi:hypothetical protein
MNAFFSLPRTIGEGPAKNTFIIRIDLVHMNAKNLCPSNFKLLPWIYMTSPMKAPLLHLLKVRTNDSTGETLFSTNLFTEYKLAGNTEISLRTTFCLSSLSRFKQYCASDEALVKLFVSYC